MDTRRRHSAALSEAIVYDDPAILKSNVPKISRGLLALGPVYLSGQSFPRSQIPQLCSENIPKKHIGLALLQSLNKTLASLYETVEHGLNCFIYKQILNEYG